MFSFGARSIDDRAARLPLMFSFGARSTFEQGGFGAETAAPAAREILAELLGAKAGDVSAGSSQD